MQVVVNRWQRDVHDRGVEDNHELGARDDRERESEVLLRVLPVSSGASVVVMGSLG